MASALFVATDSIYKKMGIDSWDKGRDATGWPGGGAVICHPPCRGWGRLRAFAKVDRGEMALGIYSVILTRSYGGIVEHPRVSGLWKCMSLPVGREVDKWGGYTLCVDQSWWGHRAKKNTLLYIVGCPQNLLPPVPIRFDAIEATVGLWSGRQKGFCRKGISKRETSATPPLFAEWLCQVALVIESRRLLNR